MDKEPRISIDHRIEHTLLSFLVAYIVLPSRQRDGYSVRGVRRDRVAQAVPLVGRDVGWGYRRYAHDSRGRLEGSGQILSSTADRIGEQEGEHAMVHGRLPLGRNVRDKSQPHAFLLFVRTHQLVQSLH